MTRETKSAEDLRQMIQERIRSSEELGCDSQIVEVGQVYWHKTDTSGCNWTICCFKNAEGYRVFLDNILADFRKDFTLIGE